MPVVLTAVCVVAAAAVGVVAAGPGSGAGDPGDLPRAGGLPPATTPAASSMSSREGRGTPVDLAFPTPSAGWVVAKPPGGMAAPSSGTILATADGGRSWTRQWSGPLVPDRVTALDASHAWVLGTRGGPRCAEQVGGFSGPDCSSALLATTDGGRTWDAVADWHQVVEQVAFATPTLGVAAAHSPGCASPGTQPASCPGQVLSTTDGGRTWAVAEATPDPIVAVTARGGWMWAVEARLGVVDKAAAGGAPPALVVLASVDGGRTWATEATLPVSAMEVSVAYQARLVAGPGGEPAGGSGRASGWVEAGGSMEATADGGVTWSGVPNAPAVAPVDLVARGLAFGIAQEGAVPKSSLVLWSTTDGGRHWAHRRLPAGMGWHTGGLDGYPGALSFVDARVGWLLTDTGTWRTTDAGAPGRGRGERPDPAPERPQPGGIGS